MLGFIGFISVLLIPLGIITLFIASLMHKNKKKPLCIMGVGVTLFFVCLAISIATNDNIKENKRFDEKYNDVIESELKEIGVNDIKKIYEPKITSDGKEIIYISVNDFDYDYSILITVAKDSTWYVESIEGSNGGTYYKYHYVDEKERYDENHNELHDIYDYKTNEQIATKYIKPLTEEEKSKLEADRIAREQEEIEKSKSIIDEIGAAFDSNSISASETYKGKKYFITATVDKVDTTITGKPRISVYQSNYKVDCVFNEGALEEVKKVSKGDIITFYGTLDGWGISADFTHCYFK